MTNLELNHCVTYAPTDGALTATTETGQVALILEPEHALALADFLAYVDLHEELGDNPHLWRRTLIDLQVAARLSTDPGVVPLIRLPHRRPAHLTPVRADQ